MANALSFLSQAYKAHLPKELSKFMGEVRRRQDNGLL